MANEVTCAMATESVGTKIDQGSHLVIRCVIDLISHLSLALSYLEGQNKMGPAQCQCSVSYTHHLTRFSHSTSRVV